MRPGSGGATKPNGRKAMSEILEKNAAWLLTGIRHAELEDLPPEAQEALGNVRSTGTFVVWKQERPVAILVFLTTTPAAEDRELMRLAKRIGLTMPPGEAAKKPRANKKPRPRGKR
jgi:hypothetical protein